MKILVESDYENFVDEFHIHKPSIFKGYLIDENNNCDAQIHYFSVFGQMSDGTSCYYEVDKFGNHDESDTKWYSRGRVTIEGKKVTVFFLEAIE